MLILTAMLAADQPAPARGTAAIPNTYDSEFARAAAKHLCGSTWHWDWRWLKAVCWQESRFDCYAVSPAGACGIAQFMPRTWHEVCDQMGVGRRSPFDPHYAIPAAAWYLRHLRDKWTTERPEHERRRLALASYNAGFGNVLKAQQLCSGALKWADIRVCLRHITGFKNANETLTYVERIEGFAQILGAP